MMRRTVAIIGFTTSVLLGHARAQQRPTLGYVYPAGGQAGSTLEVQLGGYDLTPDAEVFVDDERIQLELTTDPGPLLYPGAPYWFGPRALNSYKPFPIPREVTARITIPPEMPAGAIRWQVANANGASETAEFVITRDVHEVFEQDLTCHQASRRLPALPLTLNGRLEKKEEVDHYFFIAEYTGLVTCELPNHKIGSAIQASIQIADDAGRQIADHVDTAGEGTYLTFKVNQGTRYELTLHDLDYRGNRSMVYRLSLRRGPRVVAMMPSCVPPNSETQVTFVGYGIASGQPNLETLQQKVNSGASSFHHLVETEHGSAGSIPIEVSDLREAVTASLPGHEATPISLPACVCGVFDNPRGYDVYRFNGSKGEVWSVNLVSRTRYKTLDVMFSVLGPDGKVIATSDDTAGSLAASTLITLPADGLYHLIAADQASADGSIDAIYRLCIRQPKPSFRMTAPPRVETMIGADPITPAKRRRAGQQQVGAIGIDIERIDGFTGEVVLEVQSLPPGVHVPKEIKIDAQQVGVDIPVFCDPTVTPDASMIGVTATATLDNDSLLSRQARLLLAPMLKPRAVVRPKYPDAARTVNRGTAYPAPVVIERLEQFEGPVELQMAAVPDRVRQGILGDARFVPTGRNEAVFPLIIPEWVQTDRTSRIILNTVVTVPDAGGRQRYLVNRMQQRITMNVEGALLKVSTPRQYYQSDGKCLDIPVELFRSGNLPGPVTVSLHCLGDDSPPFTAKSITIPADQHSTELKVLQEHRPRSSVEQEYIVRAEAEHRGYPVLSESKITLSIKNMSSNEH